MESAAILGRRKRRNFGRSGVEPTTLAHQTGQFCGNEWRRAGTSPRTSRSIAELSSSSIGSSDRSSRTSVTKTESRAATCRECVRYSTGRRDAQSSQDGAVRLNKAARGDVATPRATTRTGVRPGSAARRQASQRPVLEGGAALSEHCLQTSRTRISRRPGRGRRCANTGPRRNARDEVAKPKACRHLDDQRVGRRGVRQPGQA